MPPPTKQTTTQAGLFEAFEDRLTLEPGNRPSACSSPLRSDVGSTRESGRVQEAGACRAVSPLAHMRLGEVCAFCGLDVRPPGFVIPDYEELGAFCDEECADRKSRLYLDETIDGDDSTPS